MCSPSFKLIALTLVETALSCVSGYRGANFVATCHNNKSGDLLFCCLGTLVAV